MKITWTLVGWALLLLVLGADADCPNCGNVCNCQRSSPYKTLYAVQEMQPATGYLPQAVAAVRPSILKYVAVTEAPKNIGPRLAVRPVASFKDIIGCSPDLARPVKVEKVYEQPIRPTYNYNPPPPPTTEAPAVIEPSTSSPEPSTAAPFTPMAVPINPPPFSHSFGPSYSYGPPSMIPQQPMQISAQPVYSSPAQTSFVQYGPAPVYPLSSAYPMPVHGPFSYNPAVAGVNNYAMPPAFEYAYQVAPPPPAAAPARLMSQPVVVAAPTTTTTTVASTTATRNEPPCDDSVRSYQDNNEGPALPEEYQPANPQPVPTADPVRLIFAVQKENHFRAPKVPRYIAQEHRQPVEVEFSGGDFDTRYEQQGQSNGPIFSHRWPEIFQPCPHGNFRYVYDDGQSSFKGRQPESIAPSSPIVVQPSHTLAPENRLPTIVTGASGVQQQQPATPPPLQPPSSVYEPPKEIPSTKSPPAGPSVDPNARDSGSDPCDNRGGGSGSADGPSSTTSTAKPTPTKPTKRPKGRSAKLRREK
ncbi:extensin-like [Copidosoma floridanum]|uniref:extensin-like n=1 Tax=Copidosoma floridanum TaxID=29053 RepID=UPI0006C99570|nr:extensin-like [Copidosoma floridanum]